MNRNIKRLAEHAASGDRAAIRHLLEARDETQDGLFATARAARDAVFGPTAVVRGVIEIGNACTQSCLYCPMRIENRDKRYSLAEQTILDTVAAIRSAGIGVVFLQSGEVPGTTRSVGRLLPDIRRLFQDEVEILLCLGTKPAEDLAYLRQSGATSYILKHETSDPSLHNLMRHSPLAERLDCARSLLDIGYRVGLGAIVGLPGQSLDSLVDDILLPGRMGAHMASASPFIPASGTPLAEAPQGDIDTTLNVIALLRILHPRALIPSVSALEQRGAGGQLRGFQAGANVITVNFTPPQQRERYVIYGQTRFVVRFGHAVATLAAAGMTPRLGKEAFSFWR